MASCISTKADTRTHLADDRIIQARSLEETIAAIRREAGHALIRGSGLWWVDFGAGRNKGWFDHPEVLAEIDRLRALGAQAKEWDSTSVSQVALVCGPEAYAPGVSAHSGLPADHRRPTGCSAWVPLRYDLLDDLERPGLPDYRVPSSLAASTWMMPSASGPRWSGKGRTTVWLYGNGFLTPRGADRGASEALTG